MGAVSILRGGLAPEFSPCARALKSAIQLLADKIWSHPVSGRDVQFAAATIERWYYAARRRHDDPVGAFAAPCAKTAVRSPWPRRWPGG